jgi:hypothetical protein
MPSAPNTCKTHLPVLFAAVWIRERRHGRRQVGPSVDWHLRAVDSKTVMRRPHLNPSDPISCGSTVAHTNPQPSIKSRPYGGHDSPPPRTPPLTGAAASL